MGETENVDKQKTESDRLMPATNNNRDEGKQMMPADLRNWLDERTLAFVVLEAQQAVEPAYWKQDVALQSADAPRPQVLLTLLTYAYASGTLPSEEIERQTEKDSTFRYLCARTYPTESTLRQFRRQNRVLIRQCLARVFEAAWQQRFGETPNAELSQMWLPALLNLEAEKRILYAVQLDSMAMDV
jgi:hypothetical protein